MGSVTFFRLFCCICVSVTTLFTLVPKSSLCNFKKCSTRFWSSARSFLMIRNVKSRRLVSVTSQYLMWQLGERIDEILHQILRPDLQQKSHHRNSAVYKHLRKPWLCFLDGNEKTTELTETSLTILPHICPIFFALLIGEKDYQFVVPNAANYGVLSQVRDYMSSDGFARSFV